MSEFKFKRRILENRIQRNTAKRQLRNGITAYVSDLTGGRKAPENRTLAQVEKETISFGLNNHKTVEKIYQKIEDARDGVLAARAEGRKLLAKAQAIEKEIEAEKAASIASRKYAPRKSPSKLQPIPAALKRAASGRSASIKAGHEVKHVAKHGYTARQLATLDIETRKQLRQRQLEQARGMLLDSYEKREHDSSARAHENVWRHYETSAASAPSGLSGLRMEGTGQRSKSAGEGTRHGKEQDNRSSGAGAKAIPLEIAEPAQYHRNHYQHFGAIVPIHEIPISSLSGSKEFHHNSDTTPVRDAIVANTTYIDPNFSGHHPANGYFKPKSKLQRNSKMQVLEEVSPCIVLELDKTVQLCIAFASSIVDYVLLALASHCVLQADPSLRERTRYAKKLDVSRDVEYWVEQETGTVIGYDWKQQQEDAVDEEKARSEEELHKRWLSPKPNLTPVPIPKFGGVDRSRLFCVVHFPRPVSSFNKRKLIETWKQGVGAYLFRALDDSQIAARITRKFVMEAEDEKWREAVSPNYTVVNVDHLLKPDNSAHEVKQYVEHLRSWGKKEKHRQLEGRHERVKREIKAHDEWVVKEKEEISRQREERKRTRAARDRAREKNLQKLRQIQERKREEYEAQQVRPHTSAEC